MNGYVNRDCVVNFDSLHIESKDIRCEDDWDCTQCIYYQKYQEYLKED